MQRDKYIVLFVILGSFLCLIPDAIAEKGFSIEGGLLYDRPIDGEQEPAFSHLRPGFGYAANLGYDFFDKLGLELGVMHSRHDYDFSSSGGGILEEVAGRTIFFLKLRGIPLRISKSELVLAAGPALFDISGKMLVQGNDASAGFSGWGFLSSAGCRYYLNEGLAVALFFGINLVQYDRFDLLGFNTGYQGALPKGNSIYWGLTIFHRIGIPQ
jgi:hypothetical protein